MAKTIHFRISPSSKLQKVVALLFLLIGDRMNSMCYGIPNNNTRGLLAGFGFGGI